MNIQPIKQKKIYEEIVMQIKNLLSEGNLKPGDKLLSERELAERFQVSRSSVREALRALEIMGFVEVKTGGGTFVKEIFKDAVVQPLAMFITVKKGDFFETFEIRKIFETAAARLVALRATDKDLAKIEEYLSKMKQAMAIEDSDKGAEFDTIFHYAIAEATHNSGLVSLLQTISDKFHISVSAARKQLYLKPGHAEILIEQHADIFQAICNKKPDDAGNAMITHLSFAETSMAKMLKIEPPSPAIL